MQQSKHCAKFDGNSSSLGTLGQDIRCSLRAFAKSPGFAAAAILSLAIGIGANTAIFSVTNALLLRPVPYKDPDRLPQTQAPARAMSIVLRTRGNPAALTSAAKKEVHDLDPDLPMYSIRTMEQLVDYSLARRRFSMLLLGIFAGLALALASVGIYGVMAYLVNQGTREIGIRIALGATRNGILGLIVRQGISLALAGVIIGLAAAFALARFMGSLLFGITPTDAVTFTATPGLLIMVALLATYIPARRAARVDPMISLRCE